VLLGVALLGVVPCHDLVLLSWVMVLGYGVMVPPGVVLPGFLPGVLPRLLPGALPGGWNGFLGLCGPSMDSVGGLCIGFLCIMAK